MKTSTKLKEASKAITYTTVGFVITLMLLSFVVSDYGDFIQSAFTIVTFIILVVCRVYTHLLYRLLKILNL